MSFRPYMKLEEMTRKNQVLIRPATVIETNGRSRSASTGPDFHPLNWCKRTAYSIEFPPSD